MAHTAYYGILPYITIILQYAEILAYLFIFKHNFMSH